MRSKESRSSSDSHAPIEKTASTAKNADGVSAAAAAVELASTAKVAAAPVKAPKTGPAEEAATKSLKGGGQRQGFKLHEYVVYPAHGVGQIVALEEQEVAGFKLELFVINFSKDKLTLRVPTSKVAGVGMRKISDPDTAKRSLEILTGRARVKRTMWSRRPRNTRPRSTPATSTQSPKLCGTFTVRRRSPNSPIRSGNCMKQLSTGWCVRSRRCRSRMRLTP